MRNKITIIAGVLASLSLNAYAEDDHTINIKINNKIDEPFHDAEIMLDDKWYAMGEINTGDNEYDITTSSGSRVGVIKAKANDGKWISVIAKKSSPSTISIQLDETKPTSRKGRASSDAEQEQSYISIAMDAQNKPLSQNAISKTSSGFNYGWYTKCAGLAVAGGIISCQIDAEADNYNYLTFTGEGGGIGYGYVEGVWSSIYPKDQLRGRSGTFRFASFLYSSITMKDKNASQDHSWFQGGGMTVGFFGGNARINPR